MRQPDPEESDPSFRNALRVREYRLLWMAGAQSSAGDQLARIAIVLLVYARSGSAAVSAVTYALTFLPALAGGVFLSGLADRFPRRTVMVTCDLIRLLLLLLMASADLSTLVIDVILVLLVLVGAPFSAASVAVMPDVLPPRHYVAGVSLTVVTGQLAQLLAFAAGGVCVAFLGVRTTLLIDAATFAISAAVVRYGLSDRVAPLASAADGAVRESYLRRLSGGMRLISRDPLLRCLVLFAWFPVFYIAPEAIAPAYARSLGGGPTATGLLMAAMPAGTAIGVWAFGRRGSDAARARAVPYLAAGAGAALIGSWLSPTLAVSLLLWLVCGVCSAYYISVTTRFVRRTPAHLRGQVVGLGGAGLTAMQGVGSVAAGVLASAWSPPAAVGIAGVAGVLSVAALLVPLRRAERHAAHEPLKLTTTAYPDQRALTVTD
ncbi:MFS transporter [Jatrophihabitans sp.]|jgi:MFS family permease|uniref:MFS transporter n=1 Tax=Jatrophihabitans sp. TaxID=1932789 RepID=UPI002EDCD2C0